MSSNCEPLGTILPHVTFGAALRSLRGRRKGREVAAAALGPDEAKDKDRVRDYASYLSQIEHDKIESVGLARIREIATALGFSTLSSFFSAIEAAMESTDEKAHVLQMAEKKSRQVRVNEPLRFDVISVGTDSGVTIARTPGGADQVRAQGGIRGEDAPVPSFEVHDATPAILRQLASAFFQAAAVAEQAAAAVAAEQAAGRTTDDPKIHPPAKRVSGTGKRAGRHNR